MKKPSEDKLITEQQNEIIKNDEKQLEKIRFLEELELELKDRYTEKDASYMACFNKEKLVPPIIKIFVKEKRQYRDNQIPSRFSHGRKDYRGNYNNNYNKNQRYQNDNNYYNNQKQNNYYNTNKMNSPNNNNNNDNYNNNNTNHNNDNNSDKNNSSNRNFNNQNANRRYQPYKK
jgi:hypothetical protein